MAAAISSAGEPDQKKNQRKNRKKIRLKLYFKRSLNKPGVESHIIPTNRLTAKRKPPTLEVVFYINLRKNGLFCTF